jgi:hypothetical protein
MARVTGMGNQGNASLDNLPRFLYSPSRNTLSNPVRLEGGVWPLVNGTPFLEREVGFFVDFFLKDVFDMVCPKV